MCFLLSAVLSALGAPRRDWPRELLWEIWWQRADASRLLDFLDCYDRVLLLHAVLQPVIIFAYCCYSSLTALFLLCGLSFGVSDMRAGGIGEH